MVPPPMRDDYALSIANLWLSGKTGSGHETVSTKQGNIDRQNRTCNLHVHLLDTVSCWYPPTMVLITLKEIDLEKETKNGLERHLTAGKRGQP